MVYLRQYIVAKSVTFILIFRLTSEDNINTQLKPVIMTSVYTNLNYNARFFKVSINWSQLTLTLTSSVITTLVYNDTKYSVPFLTL
jgi:hypothetical protein